LHGKSIIKLPLNPVHYWDQFDSRVGTIALLRAISSFGFSLSTPFLMLYLYQEQHVSMTLIGTMMLAAGLLGAASSTLWGVLADKYGRRPPLLVVTFVRSAFLLALAWCVWSQRGFVLFTALYVISGIIGTGLFPITDAIVADVIAPDKRNEVYGVMRVVMNIAWAVGPALGGLIVHGGYYLLFLATSLAVFVSGIIAIIRLDETLPPEKRRLRHSATGERVLWSSFLQDPRFMWFISVCLLLFLVKGQLVSTISVHAAENVGLSKSQIGFLYFVNGFGVAVAQVYVSKLSNRFHPLAALAVSGVIYALGYAGIGLAFDFPLMIIAMMIITSAEVIEAPTTSAYVARLAPPGLSGTYMGAFNMVLYIGWQIGPLIGGVMMDHFTASVMVWMAIASLAVSAGIGFVLLYRGEKNEA